MLFLPMALLWGELFVHILLPQNVDKILNIFQADPVVGYIYQPNAKAVENGREYDVTYNTNSLGLRDREYDLTAKNVFRVLLFGDSLSESLGVSLEKSLSKQIEQYLQKELDRRGSKLKAEVINVSFGGYSPYHYWKSYRRWKSTFNPNLILIGFYIGNDFQCEAEDIRYKIDNGEIVGIYHGEETYQPKSINTVTNMRKWLAKKSELYVLLRNYFYYNDIIGFFTKRADAQESTKQLQPYLIPEPELFKKVRDNCLGYLTRLKKEAAYDGVPVALITIPIKIEIDNSYLKQIIKTQGLSPDVIKLDQPYKTLSEFCALTGTALFNTRDALKLHHVEEACYFKYDGHWNEKGIETAAISIIEQWKNQKLQPFN